MRLSSCSLYGLHAKSQNPIPLIRLQIPKRSRIISPPTFMMALYQQRKSLVGWATGSEEDPNAQANYRDVESSNTRFLDSGCNLKPIDSRPPLTDEKNTLPLSRGA